jgi:hypothetical protein
MGLWAGGPASLSPRYAAVSPAPLIKRQCCGLRPDRRIVSNGDHTYGSSFPEHLAELALPDYERLAARLATKSQVLVRR